MIKTEMHSPADSVSSQYSENDLNSSLSNVLNQVSSSKHKQQKPLNKKGNSESTFIGAFPEAPSLLHSIFVFHFHLHLPSCYCSKKLTD